MMKPFYVANNMLFLFILMPIRFHVLTVSHVYEYTTFYMILYLLCK